MPASTVNSPELTREQVQAILVMPLTAASVFLAAGPRIFDVTAAGPVRIPPPRVHARGVVGASAPRSATGGGWTRWASDPATSRLLSGPTGRRTHLARRLPRRRLRLALVAGVRGVEWDSRLPTAGSV